MCSNPSIVSMYPHTLVCPNPLPTFSPQEQQEPSQPSSLTPLQSLGQEWNSLVPKVMGAFHLQPLKFTLKKASVDSWEDPPSASFVMFLSLLYCTPASTSSRNILKSTIFQAHKIPLFLEFWLEVSALSSHIQWRSSDSESRPSKRTTLPGPNSSTMGWVTPSQKLLEKKATRPFSKRALLQDSSKNPFTTPSTLPYLNFSMTSFSRKSNHLKQGSQPEERDALYTSDACVFDVRENICGSMYGQEKSSC